MNDMHVSIATSHHENVIFRVLTLMFLLGVRCVWGWCFGVQCVGVGVQCVGLGVGVRMLS